ncbi:extracellular solute-binding protein [Marinicellulosiphila megalodicopiae]|uniref:extracellular solute-binding protein n=1 Tax=Marinicellulosiphila megalodicopiae TaxID=2724896 RepID=UPI003BB0C219
MKLIHQITATIFTIVLSTNLLAEEFHDIRIFKGKSIALRGEPLYQEDFTHWQYANPDAPKGGEMRLGTTGTFDNFNRYAQRGSTPANIDDYLYDTLMVGNNDEYSVLYGLIAEYIEYPSDFSWVIYHINPKATFQDGKAITSEDVAFSFNLFMSDGVPQFKTYYEGVTVEVLDELTVRFNLPKREKSLLFSNAGLTILPKHFYQDKDFSEPFSEPPLGSGQFKVKEYEMGSYIIYERDKNYWATNHPTNKGLSNFDFYRYDYFLDADVLFEAFKKGEYDFRSESIAKKWATGYVGDQFENGLIVKEEITHQTPMANQSFAFNIKTEVFKNSKVREALGLLFDFEWSNKNLFYNAYERNYSLFMNTKYAASGLPSAKELEILSPFKDQLPAELFTEEFKNPITKGDGNIRDNMRKALELLKEAGYSYTERKLVDSNGKQFEFELIIYGKTMERVAIPFKENVEKVGIKMNIQVMTDSAQYINRMRERKYDMVVAHLGGGAFPSEDLFFEWHTDYLDSTYNAVGTTDPLIDNLIQGIADNQNNEENLLAYGRALDRVVMWRHYSISQWHISKYRVAYWNKFSRPDVTPKYALGSESWWYDTQKVKALEQAKSN